MVTLDTDTVIIACSAMSLSFGAALFIRTNLTHLLRVNVAAAVFFYGVAGILIAFRAALPPWLAIVFANVLVGISVVLVHRGIWLMLGRDPPDILYLGAVTVLGVAYVAFTYPEPQIGPRLFVVSVFRVPFFISAGLAVLPLRHSGGARMLCWLLWLWAGWYLLRGGLALSSTQLAVQVRTGNLQALNYLIATIGHLLMAAALLRMEVERAVAQAGAMASALAAQRDELGDMVRRRTEDLRKAKDEAERANAAKSHFLAAASHDLRQPMQALRLFLDVLSMRLEGTSHSSALNQAAAALTSSEALLHALLEASRLDAGTMPVHCGPVRLDSTFHRLAEEVEGAALEKGLVLSVVSSRLVVDTDPMLLERALRNLLLNAIRYTAHGRVLLGCRRKGNVVRIEVWDTGIGIPADKLALVFDDFYQVGNVEGDQAKGLGLGLGIVRRIAAVLDCKVAIKSWPGRGTVISFIVPLIPEPNAAPASP